MPTLFIILGYRFYFFQTNTSLFMCMSKKGEGLAKFQLIPEIELISSTKMKPKELVIAEEIVFEKSEEIIAKWKQYFNTENNEN